jgi:hydrogenase maturation factor
LASTSKVEKLINKIEKTIKVLTIHNVMGETQIFNNRAYSWIIVSAVIEVTRKDGKWHAYYPMANIVQCNIEDI